MNHSEDETEAAVACTLSQSESGKERAEVRGTQVSILLTYSDFIGQPYKYEAETKQKQSK